ncbi:MAG: diaminopimelate epimerase [Ignavibacteriales bacterium]
MKKISFVKMSGAGNDFVLFDKKVTPALILSPQGIKKLCARGTGIGADGVLVIDDRSGYDFSMEYYNADGSTGTLCGNGARCALKYAELSGRLSGTGASFISNGNSYSGEILNSGRVRFNLGNPKDLNLDISIWAAGQMIPASFIHTGSPHLVIKADVLRKDPDNPDSAYDNLETLPVVNIGRELRYSDYFAPEGTNVNFIKVSDNKVQIRTYERGVEDETLACGTGSVASALICYLKENMRPPISLVTRSGSELVVDFRINGNKIDNLSLSGPAEVTFTGEFFSNLYL